LSELDPASHEDFEDQEEGCPSGLQPFDLLPFGVECRTVAAGSRLKFSLEDAFLPGMKKLSQVTFFHVLVR
jgi:hypothetical protein